MPGPSVGGEHLSGKLLPRPGSAQAVLTVSSQSWVSSLLSSVLCCGHQRTRDHRATVGDTAWGISSLWGGWGGMARVKMGRGRTLLSSSCKGTELEWAGERAVPAHSHGRPHVPSLGWMGGGATLHHPLRLMPGPCCACSLAWPAGGHEGKVLCWSCFQALGQGQQGVAS